MDEIKLKPCPFCGGKAKVVSDTYWGTERFRVRCSTDGFCAVNPVTCYFDSEMAAVIAWNKRVK